MAKGCNSFAGRWEVALQSCILRVKLYNPRTFHESCSGAGQKHDWRHYRDFERALPANARKPIIITEAGWDDNGNPETGGYLGKISQQQYLGILKAYDAALMQDPYVLGATVFQWGDGNWPSFDLAPMINLFAADLSGQSRIRSYKTVRTLPRR